MRVLLGAALILGAGMTLLIAQEEDTTRERLVKATYLYHFGRYIQWPSTAFASPESPFVIGMMEESPILSDLQHVTQSRTVQDRPIEVRQLSPSSDLNACHILFLSEAVGPKIQAEVIRRVIGKPVLLVGESASFLNQGGIIRFVIEDYKVRLQISKKAAERQKLVISARLLQVAHVVD